jgi:hypothetical protein
MKKMRYFLFTYTWQNRYRVGDGNLWISSDNFPSYKFLKESARSQIHDSDVIVVITGWNEFKCKEDYLAFTGEESDSENS